MNVSTENVWCIVPAAGIGKRMKSVVPKQYLAFQSTTVIEFTLKRLIKCQNIKRIIVAINAEDKEWQNTAYSECSKVVVTKGGAERSESVFNALQTIKAFGQEQDWVLVHDAARPCVLPSDIELLIEQAVLHQAGAILAAPITDTVKLVEKGIVGKTLERKSLWRALTPQIFRIRELEAALLNAVEMKEWVTDEASAIELAGGEVQVVEGRSDNIKVTCPTDLAMAAYIIEQQEQNECV